MAISAIPGPKENRIVQPGVIGFLFSWAIARWTEDTP
jgi:hypothetical protein